MLHVVIALEGEILEECYVPVMSAKKAATELLMGYPVDAIAAVDLDGKFLGRFVFKDRRANRSAKSV